jgi:hypothetical protein
LISLVTFYLQHRLDVHAYIIRNLDRLVSHRLQNTEEVAYRGEKMALQMKSIVSSPHHETLTDLSGPMTSRAANIVCQTVIYVDCKES